MSARTSRALPPGRVPPTGCARSGRRGGRHDHPRRQRRSARGRRRPRHAAALRAARPARAERRQVRLRPRPVRRLHGARRRPRRVLLRHAGLRPPGTEDQDRRGPRHRREPRPGAARLHRGAGGAVRLLHRRHDRARPGAPRAQPLPVRDRDPAPHGAQPVPLRLQHAHPARGPSRRRRDGRHAGGTAVTAPDLSRRGLLAGGALVVGFSLVPGPRLLAQEAQNAGKEPKTDPKLPGSLGDAPMLDSWIRVDADGSITVLTGKAELGQGIKTALLQVAAEELGVEPGALKLVTADTALTPNEGYTAGSHSMQDSGTAIRSAAAQVRALLTGWAAERLGVPATDLRARDGAILAPDGRRVGFGDLVAGRSLHVQAQPTSPLTPPAELRVIGKPLPRVDIPAKVTGGPSYVQDLRLPGMVHARVVRPPSYGARLKDVDTATVERLPGVLKVVRDGSYLAVIAEREWQAVKAMVALSGAATWDEQPGLPAGGDLYAPLLALPVQDTTILDRGTPAPGARTVKASYRRPYQMHAPIGPSCAVGLMRDGTLTVWTHTQGVFPLRKSIAEMLRLPDQQVRCVQVEGSGCYGHDGADDAAAAAGHPRPGPH